jgi:hypothetical protein
MILIVLTLFLRCIAQKKQIDASLIYGDWILQNRNIQYSPSIHFYKDSTAIFDSSGDTLYRFTYQINGDNLVLKIPFDNQYSEVYQINRLTKDTLILDELWEEEQVYCRK